jgi:hypothetical protein
LAPLGASLAIAIRGVDAEGCEGPRSDATIASDAVARLRFPPSPQLPGHDEMGIPRAAPGIACAAAPDGAVTKPLIAPAAYPH